MTAQPEDPRTPTPNPSLIDQGGKVDPLAIIRAANAAQPDPTDPDATSDEASDDSPTRVRFVLSRDLDKRLDKYLTDRIPFMSRTRLQRLIENDAVTVNSRKPKASTRLRIGDVVEVNVPPPPAKDIQPEPIPLEVLYEDDDLIVINKQPDIIVHPARSHLKGTMLNALAHHLLHNSPSGGALSALGEEFARPGVVHRLDRHTSGVIVFAKRDEPHWRLGKQFERREVDKRYLAIVHGEIEVPTDVIDQPLGPHPSREKGYREKYVVRHDHLGKPAVTIYRVREQYQGYTLVELELKTGRTHQIRIHLSWLGHPIVGDEMYGGRTLLPADLFPPHALPPDPAAPIIARQALHATILGFTHPTTSAPMRFTAPLRDDLANLVRLLRTHRPGPGPIDLPGATIDLQTAIPDSL